jgi:hypothetical protein
MLMCISQIALNENYYTIERVQQSLGRSGLLFVGDCKMAAHATRAFIALAGDYYLCPLPHVQRGEGELDEALERVWSGEQALRSVFREPERGEPTLIATNLLLTKIV